jgi:hypothetical protein
MESNMSGTPRARLCVVWVEVALALAAGVAAILTLLSKDWIELVFGVDPDHHSGSLEWLVASPLLAAAIGLSLAARREWRRWMHAPAET